MDKTHQIEIKGQWSIDPSLPQVYADEAILQYINDRVYLAFGQIQVAPSLEGFGSGLEIRPVARVVLTDAAFHKVVALLNSVAEQIRNQAAQASGANKRQL